MNRLVVFLVMLCVLGAMAASAQERSNLAIPYRFRLPFLNGGEYVVSASGGTVVRTYTTQYLLPGFDPVTMTPTLIQEESVSEQNDPWFDVNAVVALSTKFLVGAELTVFPRNTQVLRFGDEVDTHVAREFTIVYRPVERFEVFAHYFQDTPHWSRTGNLSTFGELAGETDTKDIRAGISYFGKF